jgi:hypothetical protein
MAYKIRVDLATLLNETLIRLVMSRQNTGDSSEIVSSNSVASGADDQSGLCHHLHWNPDRGNRDRQFVDHDRWHRRYAGTREHH